MFSVRSAHALDPDPAFACDHAQVAETGKDIRLDQIVFLAAEYPREHDRSAGQAQARKARRQRFQRAGTENCSSAKTTEPSGFLISLPLSRNAIVS